MQHVLDHTSLLTDRINTVHPGAFSGSSGDVDVIRRTASVIASVAGGGAIHYLDHNIETEDGQINGYIVIAYTDDALIVQHIEDDHGVWHLASIDVHARRSIKRIQPLHVANAIGATAENWPSRIQVHVEYSGGPAYRLPFHVTGNLELRRDLAELLPSLAADLNSTR